MDELLKYFEGIELPTKPIPINGYMTVTDSQAFIDSCLRYHDQGQERGMQQLAEYKAALEKYFMTHTANGL